MALYNFHRVLISAAILFDLAFSFWCFRLWRDSGEVVQLVMMVGSSVITIGLIMYLLYFNKSLVTLRKALSTSPTCAACGFDLRGSMAAGNPHCPECGTPMLGNRPKNVAP